MSDLHAVEIAVIRLNLATSISLSTCNGSASILAHRNTT